MPLLSPEVLVAFGLTLFAGLSTGIGSAIAFFARRSDYRFLGTAMGFSAGVMLYVSFREILPKAEAAAARATRTIPPGSRSAPSSAASHSSRPSIC
jgi:ZIP family zinc transporter